MFDHNVFEDTGVVSVVKTAVTGLLVTFRSFRVNVALTAGQVTAIDGTGRSTLVRVTKSVDDETTPLRIRFRVQCCRKPVRNRTCALDIRQRSKCNRSALSALSDNLRSAIDCQEIQRRDERNRRTSFNGQCWTVTTLGNAIGSKICIGVVGRSHHQRTFENVDTAEIQTRNRHIGSQTITGRGKFY